MYPTCGEQYDWDEALAAGPTCSPNGGLIASERLDWQSWNQVVEVVAASAGEHEGDSWLAVVRLDSPERPWAFLSAWCDYTGWGCRGGGFVRRAESREELIRMCLAEDDRQRLDLSSVAA